MNKKASHVEVGNKKSFLSSVLSVRVASCQADSLIGAHFFGAQSFSLLRAMFNIFGGGGGGSGYGMAFRRRLRVYSSNILSVEKADLAACAFLQPT